MRLIEGNGMAYTFLTWIWIVISCFIIGYGAVLGLSKLLNKSMPDIDVVWMFGVCMITVYAQTFSLVYKVGLLANIILLIMCLTIIVCERKQLLAYIKEYGCKTAINQPKWVWTAIGVLIFVFGVLSSSTIRHYDTTLYHAQSIRWIEEYGVVKGLGNLHNRLAYNSSFFSLQALYSFKYLFGQSMHSVNGVVACFFATYAIVSMKFTKDKKIYVSDFLRMSMLFYLGLEPTYRCISSPGSDFFSIGLFFYIIIKMVSLVEEDEQDIFSYALMCVLGVFAVSLKLSVAMIVLVTIIPATRLIVEKSWKEILVYITLGLIVILPFLLRNIIISGYIIYPYPELDIINVDWKMPEYTLLFDRNEIKTWGWGLNNVYLYETPLKEWFPIWYSGQAGLSKILFILNVILVPMLLLLSLYEKIKKHSEYLWIAVAIIANLLLWFVGAPLSRYGMPFMCILPAYFIGKLLIVLVKHKKTKVYLSYIGLFVIFVSYYPMATYLVEQMDEVTLVETADYPMHDCEEYILNDEKIYVQVEGDQTGYHSFPATPYVQRLELIELRGDSLEKGFRIKQEYRNSNISTYGYIAEENIFE